MTSNTQCAIGVDLGGQSVKLAVVTSAGKIHLPGRIPVDASAPADEITHLLVGLVKHLLTEAKANGLAPAAVGVAVPGYMDRDRTRLTFAANLPTLSGSTFLEDLRERLPRPVVFDADCNAATLAEHRFGAGWGVDRLIVATIGTGIGAGVMIDGQILRVRGHCAGSLGHVLVDANGPVCSCGGRGCVEALASGAAMERLATQLAATEPSSRLADALKQQRRLTGETIGMSLQENDALAQRVVAECGRWLGVAIASWSVIYDPQKVLIGGGLAGLGEPFITAIQDGFRQVAQPLLIERVTVQPAALGKNAGVIGAAAMVLPE